LTLRKIGVFLMVRCRTKVSHGICGRLGYVWHGTMVRHSVKGYFDPDEKWPSEED